jgi:hypothetical protein
MRGRRRIRFAFGNVQHQAATRIKIHVVDAVRFVRDGRRWRQHYPGLMLVNQPDMVNLVGTTRGVNESSDQCPRFLMHLPLGRLQ